MILFMHARGLMNDAYNMKNFALYAPRVELLIAAANATGLTANLNISTSYHHIYSRKRAERLQKEIPDIHLQM